MKKESKWSRLDNAAKIFPSSCKRTDTSVFRFYCQLFEKINKELLQQAVNTSLKAFSGFQSVMRKGAFWYYLETTELQPVVQEVAEPLCSKIYEGNSSSLLFEVTYFEKRINLEIYHVLADGTGALKFLKTIVYNYLKLSHSKEIPKGLVFIEDTASSSEKEADGFQKYYKKEKRQRPQRAKKAYNLRFPRNPDENLIAIEAVVDLPGALAAAKAEGTTLTAFIIALFIKSIQKEMPERSKHRPIVIMVPVNLRQFFPIDTTKNFFGLIDISYTLKGGDDELSIIAQKIRDELKQKITPDYLAGRMNHFAAIEHNVFARIAPLPFKNLILKIARNIEKNKETAVVSNMGKAEMPAELTPYIDMFGVLASTNSVQMCMCSFGNKLQIGFTSPFVSCEIQKNFVRNLTKRGVRVQIACNDYFKGDEINAKLSKV